MRSAFVGLNLFALNFLKNFYIENDEKVLGYDYQPIFSFRIRGFEFVCVSNLENFYIENDEKVLGYDVDVKNSC